MKNVLLGQRTRADINAQVQKVLRGLGNPEPPLNLETVRELLRLDRGYYSGSDDGLLRETVSRLKVAGIQVLKRPALLREAITSLSLQALYFPDQKRILLDEDVPKIKHRWNEAHEISHDIIPWHQGALLGDTEQTLTPSCHEMIEAEANYGAGQLLFLADRFVEEAQSSVAGIERIAGLSKRFGNTLESTLWRFVECTYGDRFPVALFSGHPHPAKRKPDFDPLHPSKYFVQSDSFAARFSKITDRELFLKISGYCGQQRGGKLGEAEVILEDDNGIPCLFEFSTFFTGHRALTLGIWIRNLEAGVSL